MALELTSSSGRIDRYRCQFLVREPATRRAFDLGTQALNEFGRTRIGIEWMAAQTGPITAPQRFARCRKKIDVLARRFFRCARRPAENSGGTHSDVKNSFKTRIAIHQRAIHRFRRRKKFGCFHMRSTPNV